MSEAQRRNGVPGVRQAAAARRRRCSRRRLVDGGLSRGDVRSDCSSCARARSWAELAASGLVADARVGRGRARSAGRCRRAATRWASASSSISTSASCAGWRTTPAPCSSCSTPRASCAPSAAAAATTTCCSRSAAWISPRSASAWATWCWASCSGSAGWRPTAEPSVDVFLAAITPGRPARTCSALAHELRDAGLRVEYALGAPGGGQAAQAGRRAGRAVAVVIGPDDRARGEVMVKDLRGKGAGVGRAGVGGDLSRAVRCATARRRRPWSCTSITW